MFVTCFLIIRYKKLARITMMKEQNKLFMNLMKQLTSKLLQ